MPAIAEDNIHSAGDDGPLRVCIIEDSRAVVEALSEQLNEIPDVSVVGTADSEASAIALLSGTEYDIAILDIQLRSGTGIGVLRAIAKAVTPVAKHTNMIFSNYAESEYRAAAARVGAQYFFDKTTDTQALLDTVARLTAER